MALVLHLGGVSKCMRLICEWSVHDQESEGGLQVMMIEKMHHTKQAWRRVHEMRLTNCCFVLVHSHFLNFYFVSWGERDSYQVFADGFHLLCKMIIHIKNALICTPWHYFAQGYFALLRSSVAVGSNADMLSDTLHPPGRVFTSSWEGTPPLIKGNQQWR